MASSSRLCSDEELQKARDDLKELLARNPIPDEFKCPDDEEERERNTKLGKKKKTRVLPQEYVEILLNYRCRPIPEHNGIDKLAQEDRDTYGDYKTLATVVTTLCKRYDDIIHAAQEKMRREVETKGCFTYEVTDDEAEDDNEGAMSSQQRPRGRGRRRHRPGVLKHARGGAKKLN